MNRNRQENIYRSLEEIVQDFFGKNTRVIRTDGVSGGDINRAYRLSLSTGDSIFVKINSIRNLNFFLTESAGLRALQSLKKIGDPEMLGAGVDAQKKISFLVLEYIESSPRITSYWETFGHELARLHRAECMKFINPDDDRAKYGFMEDNYIGTATQKNQPMEKWSDFYRECRLLPQIAMAERYFDATTRKKVDWLLGHLDSYLREPDFSSLLHGDLWSGNMLCGSDGKAWILDPAAYVGDFEADLAMTQLFGSLPEKFYDAYNEINPIDRKGYKERRKLYDLYHLLNHLNLFGEIYLESVTGIINWFGGKSGGIKYSKFT